MCEVDASVDDTLRVLDASVLAGFGLTKPELDRSNTSPRS